jgi:hypothetical protein
VGPFELALVLLLASAVEVRGSEEVMQDEVVQNDGGGRPPGRTEKRLHRRRVERVVPDLKKEDVVSRDESAFRPRRFVRGHRHPLREAGEKLRIVVGDAGARRRQRTYEAD